MSLAPLALLGCGFALLVHAGYSAVHFQRLVEARYGEVAAPLPRDVYLELAAAAALSLLGALASVGALSPIYAEAESPNKCVGVVVLRGGGGGCGGGGCGGGGGGGGGGSSGGGSSGDGGGGGGDNAVTRQRGKAWVCGEGAHETKLGRAGARRRLWRRACQRSRR